MNDLALAALLVPLGAFVITGLWITVGCLLVETHVREGIGR